MAKSKRRDRRARRRAKAASPPAPAGGRPEALPRDDPAARPVPAAPAAGRPEALARDAPAAPGDAVPRSRRLPSAPIVVVFAGTLVLSSALLFVIQPMFARFVLPLLGSTPAVWTTALLFFQTTLLAGYLYAHVTTRLLGARRQSLLHLPVLLLALVAVPIGLPAGWDPPTTGSPTSWLLALLAVAVGLPFFAVAATAPLLQAWLAGTDTAAARDPYPLYWASNAGSIVGLLAYPLVLEPSLRLADQGRLWGIGYGAFLLLMALSAALLLRSRPPAVAGAATSAGEGGPAGERGRGSGRLRLSPVADAPVTVARRARWVALAFAPSSLLLGVTSFLTTDLAPVPLLWVVPLALYLLTFVLTFSGTDWALPSVLRAPGLWIVAYAMILPLELEQPLALLVLLHLGTFFVVALACHGALARDRPPARHLTGFYLWLSLGGALGGVFNAILAPRLFDLPLEYPLALVIACLLLTPAGDLHAPRQTRWLDVALPLGLGVAVFAGLLGVGAWQGPAETLGRLWMLGLAGSALLAFSRRPLRLGLGVAAVLVGAGLALADERRIFTERSFFGVHRVQVPPGTQVHQLVHGTTVHGAQDRRRPREPLTYYHRAGPLGDAFRALPDRGLRRVGVIGLGTGSAACLGRPGERWTFFEIDAVVARIARDPALFSFLRDCPPESGVVLGDARLSLRRRAAGEFDVLIADAFSSSAIPVHLLTREALDLYAAKLAPGGAILFNISNRYLKLEPVLAALAADRGLACVGRDHDPGAPAPPGISASHWLALAARPADLGTLPATRGWRRCVRDPGARPWTDDHLNLLSAL